MHNAYKLEKQPCKKPGCKGVLKKKVVGGRVARYCPEHQKLY